jgi:hypothetical protein
VVYSRSCYVVTTTATNILQVFIISLRKAYSVGKNAMIGCASVITKEPLGSEPALRLLAGQRQVLRSWRMWPAGIVPGLCVAILDSTLL